MTKMFPMCNHTIEAMAIMVEVEGMKILNKERMEDGASVAYDEHYFYQKAEELRAISSRCEAEH